MKVDITTDAVARSLYLHGPAGIQTIAADLERREVNVVGGLAARLGSMLALGQVAVRQVQIAGQVVDLYFLAGNGIG